MRTFVILFLLAGLEATAQRRGGGGMPRSKATGAPGADLDILNSAVASFDGTLRSLDKKHVFLEMGEEQTLSIEITKKTQYYRGTKTVAAGDISTGAIVTVEAKKIANQLVAVVVRMKDPQPDAGK